jgi:integrase
MATDRTGYVFQDKAGRWYARITITDSSGKRRNVKRRARDKSDAKEILKKLLHQIEEEGSRFADASRITFNDLADYYESRYLHLAEYRDGRKISGLRDVSRPLGCLRSFRVYFGRKKLREITYGDIYAYRADRLKVRTKYKRPLTIASINRELAVLRRILNIALREGWILKNPFTCGDPLISVADERRRERILTLEEEGRLLAACEHPQRQHLRLLLIFLLDTGCRKSEALKLRWRSVDFDARLITIEGMTTKTLKARQVAMTERVYRELKILNARASRDSEGLVFGITDNVRNSFKSVCQATGIKHGGIDGLTIHCLRHTAETRLVNGHLPLQMVGRILGHSQPQTTYRYLSANMETARQAAAVLDTYQAVPVESEVVEVASEMVN